MDFSNGSVKHFKFVDLDPEAKSLTRMSRSGLITNIATGGFIYKKSGSWTEYFRLWGGAVTWKRKYIIVTNVGLIIFDES